MKNKTLHSRNGTDYYFFWGKLGWAISVQEKNNNGPFLLAKSTKEGKETGHNECDNSSVLHYKHGIFKGVTWQRVFT